MKRSRRRIEIMEKSKKGKKKEEAGLDVRDVTIC